MNPLPRRVLTVRRRTLTPGPRHRHDVRKHQRDLWINGVFATYINIHTNAAPLKGRAMRVCMNCDPYLVRGYNKSATGINGSLRCRSHSCFCTFFFYTDSLFNAFKLLVQYCFDCLTTSSESPLHKLLKRMCEGENATVQLFDFCIVKAMPEPLKCHLHPFSGPAADPVCVICR